MARSVVELSKQGRLTLPAHVRRRLGLGDGSRLQVDVEDRTVRLRPIEEIPAEDAALYTPESLASIRRALADIRAGRLYTASVEDFEKLRFPVRLRTKHRRAKR